jgi:acetyl esterase/lipase
MGRQARLGDRPRRIADRRHRRLGRRQHDRRDHAIAKQRSGPKLAAQVLFYPVADASFDTDSYHQFANGYFLSRDAMKWFWDQYTTDDNARNEITASPLRATRDDLAGLRTPS